MNSTKTIMLHVVRGSMNNKAQSLSSKEGLILFSQFWPTTRIFRGPTNEKSDEMH